MGSTRLSVCLLFVASAFGVCDQPNQLGNNCETVNVYPTNVNNSSIMTQTVTHVTSYITMPNGTITTIINTINYLGNSSEHIATLQSAGNVSTAHTTHTTVIVQSDNSAVVALGIIIICLAVLKELMPWLKNRCSTRRQVAAAKVEPADIASIQVNA